MTMEQRIHTIAFSGENMTVRFSDGREVTLPVSYFPRLQSATASQREQWSLIGRGLGVHWESVDEDLSVENILLAYSRHRKESYAQAAS